MSRNKRDDTIYEESCIPLVSRAFPKRVSPYSGENDYPYPEKQIVGKKDLKTDRSLSYRLKARKKLLNRLQMIVNVEFVLEMVGFLTMLTTTEFHIQKIYPNDSDVILVLKLVMTSSTVMLMMAVFMYHVTALRLTMTDKNVDDWRMVITVRFLLKAIFELMICSIHPIPGDVKMQFITINGHHGKVSIDAILSILMLLRLYIVAKFVMMHSPWMVSTSMQSIGALNKVEINSHFILRCLMKDNPGMLIVSIMFAIFITNSWAMRTCESYYVPDNEQSGFLDSMWLVSITFLTVGYGDLSPNSYCGRVIAVETGLMGVAITAMLVTVMTSKFGQTRAERYVHAFMARINLEKNKKNAAADIIKLTMMNWLMKRHNKLTTRRKMLYQMRLSRAVQTMKAVHQKNLNIIEDAIGIVEVSTNVENVGVVLTKITNELTNAACRDVIFETRLKRIDSKLNAILNGLNLKNTDRQTPLVDTKDNRCMPGVSDSDRRDLQSSHTSTPESIPPPQPLSSTSAANSQPMSRRISFAANALPLQTRLQK